MIYYLLALASIVINGLGQVMLKAGARPGGTFLGAYLNRSTIAGYALFLAVVVMSTYALLGMELKTLYAIASLNYAVVLLLSWLLLKEKLTRSKVIGAGLVVAGIIIFNL